MKMASDFTILKEETLIIQGKKGKAIPVTDRGGP
jgi:hypothetical protein